MNNTITGGDGTPWTLYTFKGTVMEASKNMETRVSGGGGGGFTYRGTGGSAPVSITSTTVVHDQLFLQDEQGQEHALQLQGFNIACRTSHVLTAAWAIKQGQQRGPYFAVHNHTTDQTFYKDDEIGKMFRPPILHLLGIVAGLFLYVVPGVVWGVILYRRHNAQVADFKSGLRFQ
ncbi:MAG TPA: hypothetical protein PKJ19_04275 [Flavobacteriales bacterium]|nr:hypothetical protein [Flavobacteriales bacterium]HNU58057.1 hypothetical protein [Flavobacteriales bacterium]